MGAPNTISCFQNHNIRTRGDSLLHVCAERIRIFLTHTGSCTRLDFCGFRTEMTKQRLLCMKIRIKRAKWQTLGQRTRFSSPKRVLLSAVSLVSCPGEQTSERCWFTRHGGLLQNNYPPNKLYKSTPSHLCPERLHWFHIRFCMHGKTLWVCLSVNCDHVPQTA